MNTPIQSFRSNAVCETYSGGKVCAPYLDGQQVYMKLAGDQPRRAGIVSMAYDGMSRARLTPTCKRYVLPALCNYYFPPCDTTAQKPTPRRFCQDDCLVLKNDACRAEFAMFAAFGYKSMLPNCADMPAAGSSAYKTCIRVVKGKSSGSISQVLCVFGLVCYSCNLPWVSTVKAGEREMRLGRG